MTGFNRILVLIDGSSADRNALEYGTWLARAGGSYVHIAGALGTAAGSVTLGGRKDATQSERTVLEAALRRACDYAERLVQAVTTELLVGPIFEAVIHVIQTRSIELVTIGESEESLDRSERSLVYQAPCPVFVARDAIVRQFTGMPGHRTQHWEVRHDKRVRSAGIGRMLEILVRADDEIGNRPLYEVIVERLRQQYIVGVMVFRLDFAAGPWHPNRSSRRRWSRERAVMVTFVLDTEIALQRVIDGIHDLVTEGLILSTSVEAIKYQPWISSTTEIDTTG